MGDDHRWVERELASLPTQPMPDSVRARMDAAIAAESATPLVPRQQGDPAATPEPAVGRPPRARHRWLLAAGGVAAALALVMVVDPFLLDGGEGESYDTATESLAEQSTQESASGEADSSAASPESAPGAAPGSAAPTDVVVASGTTYTRQELADQTQRTLQARSTEDQAPPSAAAPVASDDPAAEPRESTVPADPMACAGALPGDGELQFVDQAGFEGEAALVTARLAEGVLEVFVQDPSCTADDPALRYRATVGAPGQPGTE